MDPVRGHGRIPLHIPTDHDRTRLAALILEWRGWHRSDEVAERAGRLFGKLLAATFAIGVATGILMEFLAVTPCQLAARRHLAAASDPRSRSWR
jgi:hypothetical protein